MDKIKHTAALTLLVLISGCVTTEEMLARRVGCNHRRLSIQREIHPPGYNEYQFTCEGTKYICKDSPFHKACRETGKAKGDSRGKKTKRADIGESTYDTLE